MNTLEKGIQFLVTYRNHIMEEKEEKPVKYEKFKKLIEKKRPLLGKVLNGDYSYLKEIIYIGKSTQLIGKRLLGAFDPGSAYPLCWLGIPPDSLLVYLAPLENHQNLKKIEGECIGALNPILNNKDLNVNENNEEE